MRCCYQLASSVRQSVKNHFSFFWNHKFYQNLGMYISRISATLVFFVPKRIPTLRQRTSNALLKARLVRNYYAKWIDGLLGCFFECTAKSKPNIIQHLTISEIVQSFFNRKLLWKLNWFLCMDDHWIDLYKSLMATTAEHGLI